MPRVQATNRVKLDNMSHTLHFNGSERIALTTMGNLGSSMAGAFSFGCWLKTTSMLTTAQFLFGTSNSSGNNYAFAGMTRASNRVGKLNFQLRDNSGRVLTMEALNQPVNTGNWLHIVWTKDATNTAAGIKLYINGVAETLTTVSSTGYAGPIDFNRAVAIGASLGSGAVASGWVGSISRPYFYKSELTATQVSNWYYTREAPSGAFAYYLNTEGSGTAVADGNATHNGTLTSSGQWSSTDRPYASRVQRQL